MSDFIGSATASAAVQSLHTQESALHELNSILKAPGKG
jgi:hypothetical protein